LTNLDATAAVEAFETTEAGRANSRVTRISSWEFDQATEDLAGRLAVTPSLKCSTRPAMLYRGSPWGCCLRVCTDRRESEDRRIEVVAANHGHLKE
jgi:hypothetical protein